MRFIPWISAMLSAAGVCASAAMAQTDHRPQIALVLSGGGAAGVAHVGVIKELERLGIRPDIITGTSMGAVVGGLYASGFTPEDLERAVTEIDWTRILDDASERDLIQPRRRDSRLDPFSVQTDLPIGLGPDGVEVAAGLVDGVKLTAILRQLSVHVDNIEDFDNLPIRFRAVATDLVTAEPVVLGSGDLGVAMRASMSIPGFFPPVKLDGRVLVDGGVTNNLPIDVAREIGADIVIASFIPPANADPDALDSLTGSLGQAMAIFIHARSRYLIDTLAGDDVLLRPGVENVGMLAFEEAPGTIDAGVAAVQAQREALLRLTGARAPLEPRESIGDTAARPLSYDRILVNYDGRLDPEIIKRRLNLPESGTTTPQSLEIAVRRVYGLELFESVTYRFERMDGERVLVVDAVQQNQGLLRPRLGVALSNIFGGDSDVIFGAGVTVPEINSMGGRIDLDVTIGRADGARVQYEQPLDKGLQTFFGAEASYLQTGGTLYAGVDDPLSEIDVATLSGRMLFGWSPGDWGGFGPFVSYTQQDIELSSGTIPGLGDDDVTNERVLIGLFLDYDTLDDTDLPKKGIQVGATAGLDPTASDAEGVIEVDALAAQSFGATTISPYIFAAGDVNGDEFRANFVGGFPVLPGFDDNELVGSVVSAAGVRVYRRADFIPFFGTSTFYGGSLAYGGAFAEWEDVVDEDGGFLAASAFAGVETSFGPAMLSFGAAEQGQYSGAFTLGRRF
ncbi:MAG: patatin-like phospholipase family protein [Pseudomonadota bacterium]